MLVLCAGGVAACLATSCTLPARNPRFTLRVNPAPDANGRTPVPIDLVFVWDQAVAAQVKELTARDWFGRKPQFRQDDPHGTALTICEWEWVPGQRVPDINVVVPAAARSWLYGAFAFANYRKTGLYRFQLAPGTTTILHLLEDRVAAEPPRPLTTATPDYVVLSSLTGCTPLETSRR
jgi:type VI secretion system protein